MTSRLSDQVKDGEDSQSRGLFEEVDPSGVAHGQDEDDGAARHRELTGEVPQLAEVVAVQRCDHPIELVANLKLRKSNFLLPVANHDLSKTDWLPEA